MLSALELQKLEETFDEQCPDGAVDSEKVHDVFLPYVLSDGSYEKHFSLVRQIYEGNSRFWRAMRESNFRHPARIACPETRLNSFSDVDGNGVLTKDRTARIFDR